MFAKKILPLFGGSPAVWNTSMQIDEALNLRRTTVLDVVE
jgi:hypothetical protein